MINGWRANLQNILDQWVCDHGVESQQQARVAPMMLIPTRWGSLAATLAFLTERGRQRIACTLPKVLAKKGKNNGATSALNIEAAEGAPETYLEKISRWHAVAVKACFENLWWAIVHLLDVLLDPLTHFFKKCAKLASSSNLLSRHTDDDDNDDFNIRLSRQVLLELATGGAREIQLEIAKLKPKLKEICGIIALSTGITGCVSDAFNKLAYDIWAFMMSSFDRRIFSVVTKQLRLEFGHYCTYLFLLFVLAVLACLLQFMWHLTRARGIRGNSSGLSKIILDSHPSVAGANNLAQLSLANASQAHLFAHYAATLLRYATLLRNYAR